LVCSAKQSKILSDPAAAETGWKLSAVLERTTYQALEELRQI
jgi:hypothetical protein